MRILLYPIHSSTSNMDPHTTWYTQNSISLYSQDADPTWDNITFRHAILCDAATDHYLGLLKVSFKALALKSLLPFHILTSKSIHHITHQDYQHTATILMHPLANSQTISTTKTERKGDSTDHWCIPNLTSNSSDNSESTLTLVSVPSYKLFTDLTNTSSLSFFHIAHSNTFLGTPSKAVPRSTKHMYYLFTLA